MPLPTPAEIEAGFEQNTPTPAEAQRILASRAILVTAGQAIVQHLNDNVFATLLFNNLEAAFVSARSSIMNP